MGFFHHFRHGHIWSTTAVFVLAARTTSFKVCYLIFYYCKRMEQTPPVQNLTRLWYCLDWDFTNERIVSHNDDQHFSCLQIHWQSSILMTVKRILNNLASSNFKLNLYKVGAFDHNHFFKQLPPSIRQVENTYVWRFYKQKGTQGSERRRGCINLQDVIWDRATWLQNNWQPRFYEQDLVERWCFSILLSVI